MGWFGLFMIFCAYWFFRSPLPGAIAEGMRRQGDLDPGVGDAVAGLANEVHGLRDEVMELAERLDFTERMLADMRRRAALPPPGPQ